LAVSLVAAVISAGGCQTLMFTGAYLIRGTDVDAEYDGLKERKVAVVCRPLASLSFRDCNVARDLSREVAALLATNVRKIELIDQDDVFEWTDEHEWSDFEEIGAAVEADLVVGIDLLDFSIHQGQTLYQGRANVSLKVVDCTAGDEVVFEKELPETLYPPNTGVEAFSTPEREFRRKFVGVLAEGIARHFYPHDPHANFAMDATLLD
jgi:hypothetical protein